MGSSDVLFKQELLPLLESLQVERWGEFALSLRVESKGLKQDMNGWEAQEVYICIYIYICVILCFFVYIYIFTIYIH